MSTRVRARARSHIDRSGDPLDGLVNLFDLAIVLAVAFLLSALTALRLGGVLTGKSVAVIQTPGSKDQTIVVKNGSQLQVTHLAGQHEAGVGEKVGIVYRLRDGRLVYVTDSTSAPKK
jgi:hypothetical protein